MRTFITLALLFLDVATRGQANTLLVSFDGNPKTAHKFEELNDPVMGGKSTGTWNVNATGQYAVFDGDVVDVPSLKAPGFIKAAADGHYSNVSDTFADGGGGITLMVRSSTPSYGGYRLSFASGTLSPSYSCAGGGSIPFSRGCFKTNFTIPPGDEFVPVFLPYKMFSDKWSPATGAQTTTCAQDKDVCPSAKTLSGIVRFEVWAEGALGKIHLELQSILASPTPPVGKSKSKSKSSTVAASSPYYRRVQTRPPVSDETCKGPVQKELRYNISGRTTPTVPIPVSPSESLAEAVCCDKRVVAFAEPQFLFAAPDIDLFSKISADGVTTFYDSVCGLPLFKAPVGRTFEEFKSDTHEHGWPSFRPEEVVTENLVTDKSTGLVTSKCGTHLGSYLPDDAGPRWCIDLSCIAGSSNEYVPA